MVEVFIQDQAEKFPKDERTIDWIGSLMDRYAAAWHIQWIKGTLRGKHPKRITGYIQALKLRLVDKDAKDEVYTSLEKIRYDGCIWGMFTQIQMYNDKSMVSSAALKKIILDRLPHKILEQMHTVVLTGKTDDEIISIITNAGRTAEKSDEAKMHFELRKSISDVRKEVNRKPRFKKETRLNKTKTVKKRFQGHQENESNPQFKTKNKSNNTCAELTEGIDKSESH